MRRAPTSSAPSGECSARAAELARTQSWNSWVFPGSTSRPSTLRMSTLVSSHRVRVFLVQDRSLHRWLTAGVWWPQRCRRRISASQPHLESAGRRCLHPNQVNVRAVLVRASLTCWLPAGSCWFRPPRLPVQRPRLLVCWPVLLGGRAALLCSRGMLPVGRVPSCLFCSVERARMLAWKGEVGARQEWEQM